MIRTVTVLDVEFSFQHQTPKRIGISNHAELAISSGEPKKDNAEANFDGLV